MHIPPPSSTSPSLVAEDYGRIDGRTAYGSDAQGLSLGLAQWNDRGKVDISAKVWRHTGRSGPASRRSCPSTGCWIWRFWPAGPSSISRRRPTASPGATTRSIPRWTASAAGGRHDGGGMHLQRPHRRGSPSVPGRLAGTASCSGSACECWPGSWGSWGCRSRSRPGGEWGISMTIADFLSDRLGRIVLQGGCAAASALFLLATGTQPAWWLCS